MKKIIKIKKRILSLLTAMTVSLSVMPAAQAKTVSADSAVYDFQNNTLQNNAASDISNAAYIPTDAEQDSSPYKGEIVYGAFGKKADDAAYRFTTEYGGALPTTLSPGTNIKSPFIQFYSGTKTLNAGDIVHISFEMLVSGNSLESFTEIRPYTYNSSTSIHSTKRFANAQAFNFSQNTVSKSFAGSVSSTYLPYSWKRFDIVLDTHASVIENGEEVTRTVAYSYIDGNLVKGPLTMDADNTADGIQCMSGLDHIRFFLSPKMIDGKYPHTEIYFDNISIKTLRGGSKPVITADPTLSSAQTEIDNSAKLISVCGMTPAQLRSSISGGDGFTFEFTDADGNGISDSSILSKGDYLRAVNAESGSVTYYLFTASNDTKITSDILYIENNTISGYKEMTLSEAAEVIKFPYASTYKITDENGLSADLSQKIKKGMIITVTSESGKEETYAFGQAYYEISVPKVTVDGYAASEIFAAGSFKASADITNCTDTAIRAKVICAQYSAGGRLKAYGVSPVTAVSEKETLTASMNVKSIEKGDTAKVFVWTDENAPLTEYLRLYAPDSDVTSLIKTYPTYTTKALTFSFDDGAYGSASAGDKRILDIFAKYGVKSTWNIVSSRVNDNFMKNYAPDYLAGGNEIANHTWRHLRMSVENEPQIINGTEWPPMTTEECKAEIGQGKAILEQLFNTEVPSLIWSYGAPSNRSDYAELMEYARSLGIKYVRPTQVNGSFGFPANWYDWRQTARITNPDTLLTSYLNLSPLSDSLKQFSIWGHAYELTYAQLGKEGNASYASYVNDMDYDELDAFCKAIADEGETWFCTNLELYDYYTASENLTVKNGVLYNDSDIDLYAVIDSQRVKIPAHGIGAKK